MGECKCKIYAIDRYRRFHEDDPLLRFQMKMADATAHVIAPSASDKFK